MAFPWSPSERISESPIAAQTPGHAVEGLGSSPDADRGAQYRLQAAVKEKIVPGIGSTCRARALGNQDTSARHAPSGAGLAPGSTGCVRRAPRVPPTKGAGVRLRAGAALEQFGSVAPISLAAPPGRKHRPAVRQAGHRFRHRTADHQSEAVVSTSVAASPAYRCPTASRARSAPRPSPMQIIRRTCAAHGWPVVSRAAHTAWWRRVPGTGGR